MWININTYRNISTNINNDQQITTNMNTYQGNTYEQISSNMNKSANCLPVEFALCENYVKSITHGSPNLSAEQSQEQKSIKHKSKSMNITMIQYNT